MPTVGLYVTEEEYSEAVYEAMDKKRKVSEVLQDWLHKGLEEYKKKAKK